MRTLLFLLISIAFVSTSFAQSNPVPENYKMVTVEDVNGYQEDALECMKWLMNTPFNKQKADRKEVNKFVMEWINSTPNVTVELRENIIDFIESTPDLLLIYMAGWSKYSIENNAKENTVDCSVAGIEAVINFYKKNNAFLPKNKSVEKYIKMQEKGTLKAYIEKNSK